MLGEQSKGSLLIKGGTLITGGADSQVLSGHDVLVQDGVIRKIAPRLHELPEIKSQISTIQIQVIDAHDKVVMPGLINAHMHFYSTLVRGLGKAKPSKNFNEVLQNLWWRLDQKLTLEDCYWSAKVALVDAIKKGTTTLFDHHASPGAVLGSLDQIAKAVRQTGLRASLCYELSDRDGTRVADEGLGHNIEFIKSTLNSSHPMLRAHFGLHASFTVSDPTLSRAVEAARDLGVGFHVHAAEALSDQEHCLEHHKSRVIERFKKAGVLGPNTICAHGVHLNKAEIECLNQTQTWLIHNPQSNMNNGVGAADLVSLVQAGVKVGLGTDAMTVNMFEELRVALWLAKHKNLDPSVGFMEAFNALFTTNPLLASHFFGKTLGVLVPGAEADLILMDYHAPTPLTNETQAGHLVFGLSQAAVDTTIVAGQVLMQNKILHSSIDEAQICARAKEQAEQLWKRF